MFYRAARVSGARLLGVGPCLSLTLLLGAGVSVGSGFSSAPTSSAPAPRSQPFVLGPRIPVNPPNVGYHGQVLIAADPESATNLIVCGFRENQRTGSSYEGYVYQSVDAGKTWREVLVDANSQWVSEESCAFGPGHRAYFATGVSDTSRGHPRHQYGNLHLYRSADGGSTWQTILVSRFMDWTSMAVDSTDGLRRNTLYIFANLLADGTGGWMTADKGPFLATFREAPEMSFSVSKGDFNAGETGAKLGKYPTASLVLSDGDVLAMFRGDKEISNEKSGKKTRLFSIEAGVSRDGGKTLEKTIVSEGEIPLTVIGPTGLAENPVSGEIYVCWTPHIDPIRSKVMEQVQSELVLARSHDEGQTWAVRTVRAPRERMDIAPDTVSLAVNKDGIVGFMWYSADRDKVYFGASFDGGDSIAQIGQLTPAGLPSAGFDGLAADDRRLFVFPPSWNASSNGNHPLTVLGFSPNPKGVPLGNALVADRNGTFHPVWTEVKNGPAHLWTRAVSFPAPGESARVPTLAGLTDVSNGVASHISNVRFDHLDNLIAFDITVTNHSEGTIGGPLVVTVASSVEQLEFSADNADNDEHGEGALWNLRIPGDLLGPEQSSQPRTLTFHPRMGSDHRSEYYLPHDIPLRIYGMLPRSAH